MKRLYILLLMLFSVQALTRAQSIETKSTEKKTIFKIGLTGGIAFFNEYDLKKSNAEVIRALPFDLATIDNFPPTLCYGGYVLSSLDSRISLGLSYQYYTTGSRLGAKDYSATYSFDQIISAHSLGIVAEFPLSKIGKAEFFCETTAGIHLASWKIEQNFTVGQENEKKQEKLEAIKPFFYPCFKLSYPITPHIAIAAKGGYSFDISGKFKLENDPESKSDKNVLFSGARLTLALEYSL